MTIRVAVPIVLARMRVVVDHGIHWNSIERLLLWSLREKESTPSELAADIDLPRRLVSEMVWKLMRFGWIELAHDGIALRPTMAGIRALHVDGGLPSLVWPAETTVRVVFEPTQGRAFPTSEVIVRHKSEVAAIAADHEMRWLHLEQLELPTFDELNRAAQTCLLSSDEEFVRIIPERSKADPRFLVATVHGKEIHGLPKGAPYLLSELIVKAAGGKRGMTITVPRRQAPSPPQEVLRNVSLHDEDILLDGAHHRQVLGRILRAAHHRVILHSTFLTLKGFEGLRDDLRTASRQGAQIDLLYGANKDDRTRLGNAAEATAISDAAAKDPLLRNCVRVHLRSTHSHAKLVIADTGNADSFVAIVGSCNWLSTPYQRVEASVVFRDDRLVAQLLEAVGEMCFAVARSSRLTGDIAKIATQLVRKVGSKGDASATLVLGTAHDDCMRRARDESRTSILVGADRFGQPAEVKTLIPMIAASEKGVTGRVLFSRCVTPVTDEDLKEMSARAAEAGIELSEVEEGVLHGKFLIWDDDNVVITSLNWSSAGTRRDNPWGEIGLHICKPGVGSHLRNRIEGSLAAAKAARVAAQAERRKRRR